MDMRTKVIKAQIVEVLTQDIKSKIDLNDFARLDPDFPLPSNINLKTNNASLTDDQIDDLKEGKVVELVCIVEGTYDKTKSDGNLTKMDNFIRLNINNLSIRIVNEDIVIDRLEYTISDSRY